MTRRIISTAVITIATAALAAPAALARPADMPSAVAKTAAEERKQASQYPTRPIIDRPSYPPNKQAAAITPEPPADSGVAWSMLGLGTAGLLAAATIAAVVSRTRTGTRTRVTA